MRLLISSFLTAVMLYGASAEVEAYRKGFEHGLKMLEFQIENEGVSPKKIDIDFQYTVELNTKDLSTTEILYLQYLTARDGYQPMLIKGALLFGKFESLADAKQLSETLKRKYNFDTVSKELKPNDEIFSYPLLLLKVFNKYEKMNEEAKARKEVFFVNTFTEETLKPMTIQTEKPKAEVKPVVFKEQKPLAIIAPQEPQKETKAPLAIVEEVPTVDKNTSADPKVIAAVEQFKIEPSVIQDDNKTIKNDTKIDVNDTKVIKNDMNDTQIAKNDTKPKVEMIYVKDRPFDADPTPNSTVAKELTLVEIIEEAVAVYPNFDEKKLREDLMRLVVKNPNIDAEAVRTMPLKKGLLLELLKVAKEKQ